MAKVFAPNKQYNGISAGVTFVNGVGETTDPYLLSWFKDKGYQVEETKEPEDKEPEKEPEESKEPEETEEKEVKETARRSSRKKSE